jgi:NADH-quinone oxidoreductase subunit G
MGSNLFVHSRRGQVLRTVPRENEAVNECWLSDRDRYSHQGLYSDDRAVKPLQKVNGEWREVSWSEGLAAAAEILRGNAGDELGVLVHPATSNEEGGLLAKLAAGLGSGNVDHRINNRDFSDGAVAEPFALPLADIEKADVIVLFGTNIRHELPLLHQRIRKAQRQGARVHVVNPVDFDFAFGIAGKHIVPPSQLAGALNEAALREAAKAGNHAVLIVGGIAENHPQASALRQAAGEFAAATGASLCRIPQGANAVGLARHGVLPSRRDVAGMFAEPRKAYVIYGIEPGLDFADTPAAARALSSAKVVAFSHFACKSTRDVADVILPIGALPEIEATLTNLDGTDQRTQAAGKLPGEARDGWRVLRALGGELQLPSFEFTDLAGLRAAIAGTVPVTVARSAASAAAGEGLELAVTAGIYRTDGTVRRAEALQAHPLNTGARIVLNPADAQSSGVAEGAMAKVGSANGTATLPVVVDARVAKGSAWIESGYGATAPLGAGRVTVVSA